MKVILLIAFSFWQVLCAQTYLVAFSSNAQSSSGGANKTDFSGADLYTAFYQPNANDSVWNIKRLTNYAGKGEIFPSISPDTNWVAYNHSQKTPWVNSVRLIKRSNGQEYTLFGAGRFPQWISNNQLTLSDTTDVFILRLSFPGATPAIVSSKKVTDRTLTPNIKQCEDPAPYQNGTKLVFHGYNTTTSSTALCRIDSNSNNFTIMSPFNAYGHAIAESNNTELLATQASGSQVQRFTINTFNTSGAALALPTTPVLMNAYDARYGACSVIKWTYPALGYNDRSFFASAVGEDGSGNSLISKVFYVEYDNSWSSYTLHDFSKKVEQKLGTGSKDFITSAAQVLVLPSRINEQANDVQHLLYPNPAKDKVTIVCPKKSVLGVYNLDGKLIETKVLNGGDNSLNIETYLNGIYMFNIDNKYYKVVIQH